jgi:hypothetical protein
MAAADVFALSSLWEVLEMLSCSRSRHAPRRPNPIKDLWRQLKNKVAANLNRSLDALKEACRRFFDRLTEEQTLRAAGLDSD